MGQETTVQVLTEKALSVHSGSVSEEKEGSISENVSMFSQEANNEVVIGQRETKAVAKSKACVYFILAVGAVATAVATWFFVRNEEEDNFKSEFNVFGHQIINRADDNAKTVFRQLHTLSTAITSHALDSGQGFPNVTLPHFGTRTLELGQLSGAQLIIFAPLVHIPNTTEWEAFVQKHKDTIYHDTYGEEGLSFPPPSPHVYPIPADVFAATTLPLLEEEFLLPILQFGPDAHASDMINMDLNSHPYLQRTLRDAVKVEHTMLSEVFDLKFLLGRTGGTTDLSDEPRSVIAEPVFDGFDDSKTVVGFVIAAEPWGSFFKGGLPEEVQGFLVDVHTSCGSDMTYEIDGHNLIFRGHEDLHDPRYDDLGIHSEFAVFARYDGDVDGARHCDYSLIVYPSKTFENEFYTAEPYLFSMMLVLVFTLTVFVFLVYDIMVSRRQKKVANTAKRTTEIVQSLFPKSVGDRLIAEAEQKEDDGKKKKRLDAFLADTADRESDEGEGIFQSDPIAEFFTATTIMFADIVGFTAWSSIREPKQVFALLETIYHAFDQNADRRGVFKVETIGDCYVAVAGLPQPRKDHFTVMARFARDIVYNFGVITQRLEATLGPETSDLAIRIGLHSGPVTAGVLRGDRARFQLFGDTMNTASRMESTGKPGKIHISQETADLLTTSGKGHWFHKREDLIVAKGKGQLQTYWLDLGADQNKSTTSGSRSEQTEKDHTVVEDGSVSEKPTAAQRLESSKALALDHGLATREARLVKWNVGILGKLVAGIIHRRNTLGIPPDPDRKLALLEQEVVKRRGGALPEMKEAIDFASDLSLPSQRLEPLPERVSEQLHSYIQAVATMYRSNPFHCFEHASHAMMALMKMFARVVPPREAGDVEHSESTTFGLTADPMIQFAAALSALMHAADHPGVPNSQLVKEKTKLAVAYNNLCVTEQNSLDLSWSLLMSDEYTDLRRAIYTTEAEFKEFRQLVVNSVLTCCREKEMQARRAALWDAAFTEKAPLNMTNLYERRTTLLLEYIVQAGDIVHTMQHWQIYIKWNMRLFEEAFKAHQDGRADYDPAVFWYDAEIGFFDSFVVPFAKKLKETGVLGASGDEYMGYALRNRREWVARGRQVVEEKVQTLTTKPEEKNATPAANESVQQSDPKQTATIDKAIAA